MPLLTHPLPNHLRLLIALDADGVLLDYNLAYGQQWMAVFGGEPLVVREPRAYHATNYWGIEAPPRDHAFWAHFDQHGWKAMPAMPGAVDACRRLAAAGHTLVCVSSMPTHHEAMRLRNLQDLGFPIDRVIATGSAPEHNANPKKAAILDLQPDWFVDDELRKLKELPGVRCVLVDPGHPDCPNQGQPRNYLAMTVPTLATFADRLLAA